MQARNQNYARVPTRERDEDTPDEAVHMSQVRRVQRSRPDDAPEISKIKMASARERQEVEGLLLASQVETINIAAELGSGRTAVAAAGMKSRGVVLQPRPPGPLANNQKSLGSLAAAECISDGLNSSRDSISLAPIFGRSTTPTKPRRKMASALQAREKSIVSDREAEALALMEEIDDENLTLGTSMMCSSAASTSLRKSMVCEEEAAASESSSDSILAFLKAEELAEFTALSASAPLPMPPALTSVNPPPPSKLPVYCPPTPRTNATQHQHHHHHQQQQLPGPAQSPAPLSLLDLSQADTPKQGTEASSSSSSSSPAPAATLGAKKKFEDATPIKASAQKPSRPSFVPKLALPTSPSPIAALTTRIPTTSSTPASSVAAQSPATPRSALPISRLPPPGSLTSRLHAPLSLSSPRAGVSPAASMIPRASSRPLTALPAEAHRGTASEAAGSGLRPPSALAAPSTPAKGKTAPAGANPASPQRDGMARLDQLRSPGPGSARKCGACDEKYGRSSSSSSSIEQGNGNSHATPEKSRAAPWWTPEKPRPAMKKTLALQSPGSKAAPSTIGRGSVPASIALHSENSYREVDSAEDVQDKPASAALGDETGRSEACQPLEDGHVAAIVQQSEIGVRTMNADVKVEAETEGEADEGALGPSQEEAVKSGVDREARGDTDGVEIAPGKCIVKDAAGQIDAQGDIDTRKEENRDVDHAHLNSEDGEERFSHDGLVASVVGQEEVWGDMASAPPEGGVEWKGGDLSAVSFAVSRDACATSSSQDSELSRVVDMSVKRAERAEMVAMASAGVVLAGAAAMVIRHIASPQS